MEIKIKKVMGQIEHFGGWPEIKKYLLKWVDVPEKQQWIVLEDENIYEGELDEISF